MSHGRCRALTRRRVPNDGTPGAVEALRQPAADELMRFAGVGAISTLGYLFLFVAWRPLAGVFGANALALAICTLFNTAVHGELAGRARAHGSRMFVAALTLFGLSISLTSLALLAARAVSPSSLPLELLAVTGANAVAAVLRFAVLRGWVFRPAIASSTTPLEGS
jgi:putative flippase GtrA